MDVWFEDDPGSTARKLSILSGPWVNWKHTLWYHQALYQASDPTQLLENLTPWLIAHHSLKVVWLYWYLQSNESCTSHLGRTQIHHEWQESAKIWVGIALPPLGKYFEVGVQCHCYPRCENISHIPSTFSQILSYRQQHPPTHGHQYTCHLALCHSTSYSKLFQPATSSALRNGSLGNSRVCKFCLNFCASDNFNQIICCDIVALDVRQKQGLKSLWNVLIIKDSPSGMGIMKLRKLCIASKCKCPFPEFLCMFDPTSLDCCNHSWGFSPGILKTWIQIQVQEPKHSCDASPQRNAKPQVSGLVHKCHLSFWECHPVIPKVKTFFQGLQSQYIPHPQNLQCQEWRKGWSVLRSQREPDWLRVLVHRSSPIPECRLHCWPVCTVKY